MLGESEVMSESVHKIIAIRNPLPTRKSVETSGLFFLQIKLFVHLVKYGLTESQNHRFTE